MDCGGNEFLYSFLRILKIKSSKIRFHHTQNKALTGTLYKVRQT